MTAEEKFLFVFFASLSMLPLVMMDSDIRNCVVYMSGWLLFLQTAVHLCMRKNNLYSQLVLSSMSNAAL